MEIQICTALLFEFLYTTRVWLGYTQPCTLNCKMLELNVGIWQFLEFTKWKIWILSNHLEILCNYLSNSQVIKLYFIALILKKTAKFHTFVEQQRYEEKLRKRKVQNHVKINVILKKKQKYVWEISSSPTGLLTRLIPLELRKRKDSQQDTGLQIRAFINLIDCWIWGLWEMNETSNQSVC